MHNGRSPICAELELSVSSYLKAAWAVPSASCVRPHAQSCAGEPRDVQLQSFVAKLEMLYNALTTRQDSITNRREDARASQLRAILKWRVEPWIECLCPAEHIDLAQNILRFAQPGPINVALP